MESEASRMETEGSRPVREAWDCWFLVAGPAGAVPEGLM